MKMKLSKKTLLFGIIISISILLLLVSYLMFLLPSLYLDDSRKNSITRSMDFHATYLKTGNYSNELTPNNVSSYIIKSEASQDVVELENGYGKVVFTLKDPNLIELLNYYKRIDLNDPNFKIDEKYDLSKLGEYLKNAIDSPLFDIEIIDKGFEYVDNGNGGEFIKGDGFVMINSFSQDKESFYTMNTGISNSNQKLVISFNPYSISRIDDIKTVAAKSLPMLLAITTLITLVTSLFFANSIINPIKKVVRHLNNLETFNSGQFERLELKTGDELEEITSSIDDVYEKLQVEYKKKDIFLKSSSHQLKTPIASSMLLADSMINKVGKFKDRDKYLPILKNELISAQKMIEDILSIDKDQGELEKSLVRVDSLVLAAIDVNRLETEEKSLNLVWEKSRVEIYSSRELLKKIIENLVSNAINYSPVNEQIMITLYEYKFEITNKGQIASEIKNSIFEPFVTSREHLNSTGIGLYIAKKYADLLDYKLTVESSNNLIKFTLFF